MPLNDLSLDELRKLSDQLTSLSVSGFRLEQDGLAPRFDLTPGMPVRITLGAVMPLATRPNFGEWMTGQIESTEAAQPEPAPEPVEPPPAAGEGAGGEPISAAPSRSDEVVASPKVVAPDEAEAERGGGAVMAAAMPPAAPVPGSASALAAQAIDFRVWDDEQDAVVIDALADAEMSGTLKADALRAVAAKLQRTMRAVEQRSYRIKHKIKAEVTRRAMAQAQTESPEIPQVVPPTVDPGHPAAGGHSPVAETIVPPVEAEVLAAAFARPVQPEPDDLYGEDRDLWRHLQQNQPRWPHTAGTDLDLCVALGRGEKLPMISADLGIDPEALKQRYAALTRTIRDPKGHVTVDGGPRLIKLLRRIAKSTAEAA